MLVRLRNRLTGEEIVVDTTLLRFKRLVQAFLNVLTVKKYFLKHLTLTQMEENYKPRILNNFFTKLRRRYKDLVYIWVVEQQRRGVLHWHVVVGFPYHLSFTAEDVRYIQSLWFYGNVDIKPIRSSCITFGYLLKYISKSLSVDLPFFVRRFGSSRIHPFFRQSRSSFLRALNFFNSRGLDPFYFFWDKGNAYTFDNCGRRVYIYRRPSTFWQFVGVLS